jgi:hypothetical protein
MPSTEHNVTRSLVATTETGVTNLESAVGLDFEDLISDWLLAIFADDFVGGVDSRYTITSWDTRDLYQNLAGGFPLSTTTLGRTDGVTDYSVISGSGRYFLLDNTGAASAVSGRFTNQSDAPLDLAGTMPRILLMRLP